MKRNSHTRRLLLLVVVLVAAGLVWGLASALATSSSPSPAPAKVVLKIGWTQEPDNLNPFIGSVSSDREIWALNYDCLFGRGLDGQPRLDLAAKFPTKQNGGISADGKTWIIHLRPDLRWSDGQPLTADDVAFTYNYVVFNHIANLTLATVGIEQAEALNPTTVRISCVHPKVDMEKVFLPILPEHAWEHVSPEAATTTYVTQPPIVGSGPFYTAAFKKGSYVEMLRNPYYPGQRPAVDEILFESYQKPDTMVNDLKSGVLDAAWGIPEAQFAQLSAQPGIHTVAYDYYNWDYLGVNCYTGPSSVGNPVLRDWRFRNALNYAIDRNQLCQLAYDGRATPGTTILPPDTWSKPDYHWQPPAAEAYTFDLGKASQLLSAAGYPLKNGLRLNKQGQPITLRLCSTTDLPQGQVEATLIASWLQQLGIKIDLSVIDRSTLEAHVFNTHIVNLVPKGSSSPAPGINGIPVPDFDMYVDDCAGYLDPGETLTAEATSQIGSSNDSWWSNAAYDKLDLEQGAGPNGNQRKSLIWQMQQLLYQQSPQIVLDYPQYLEAYDTSRWTGWTQMFHGHGPAFMTTGNVDWYLKLRPVPGMLRPVAAKASNGKSIGTTIAIVVAVVAVLAGGGIWLLRRRRRTRQA